MRMILKKIHIQNFKGCKDRTIEFGSKTNIKGQNGSGKTTIADAVMWVLFGKDSSGASSFDIRPKDKNGVDEDFIDIQVETVWDVDGRELTIVKTQKQNWVKKRGSEEKTFEGNVNLYEVNTIPKAEKEFKAYIEELVPEEVFKFVSNTNAFMAQKPIDRRKTLFKLVSDITDEDVMDTDPKFESLKPQLAQFTSEEILSRDKKALFENKKKLEEIPARIDEVSKSIVEQDYSVAEIQLQDLRDKLTAIDNAPVEANIYGEVNQLKADIAKYEGRMQTIEREAISKVNNARKDIQIKIIDIDQSISRLSSTETAYNGRSVSLKDSIKDAEERLKKLGEDYTAEKSKEMAEGTNTCPVCHQEYPEDMKANMKAAFEAEKEKKLRSINLEGKSVSDSIKSYRSQLTDIEMKSLDTAVDMDRLTMEKDALQDQLDAMPVSIDVTGLTEYQSIKEALQEAQGRLEHAMELTKDANAREQAVIEQKRAIQSEIDAVNRILAGRQAITNAKARVEELKEEQRRLSQTIANTEKEIYLLEEFNKAKVNLLSDKINAHFKAVKWKLFERQINGGYNPICEPLVNGQAYSSALNSGHKILAELDIIQALQRIYDVSVPVFLDNAERINDFNIPDMDCQLITLSVTEDPVLKVVIE